MSVVGRVTHEEGREQKNKELERLFIQQKKALMSLLQTLIYFLAGRGTSMPLPLR